MKDTYIYPAIFHLEEDNSYWVEFPDFPMANTQGENLEDALHMETRYHTKGSRLTAAGRAYKDDELFVFDFQIEIFYCNETVRILLYYIFKLHTSHACFSSFLSIFLLLS